MYFISFVVLLTISTLNLNHGFRIYPKGTILLKSEVKVDGTTRNLTDTTRVGATSQILSPPMIN